MDPDAPPPAEVIPPVAWATVLRVFRIGLGLVAAAVGLGLLATALGDATPWPVHTARLLLVAVGAVVAGAAVSLRPDLWKTWALGGVTALLAAPGTPAHWDSFRLLFGVLAGVCLVVVVLLNLAPAKRYALLSAVIVYHFGGIALSSLTPPPSTWLTSQVYDRFYMPYLQFLYLRNAYHFYSPQPGPASLDFFLLRTEVGKDQYEYKWVILPDRRTDVKDPLGISYVRRLALTEASSQWTQYGSEAEVVSVTIRRREVARLGRNEHADKPNQVGPDGPAIPFSPVEPEYLQYHQPRPDVARYVLPSYAQHVLLAHTRGPEEAARTTVRMYRVEHALLTVNQFRTGVDPFHPATYRPYYLGEYGFVPDPTDPTGTRTRVQLLNKRDKMLYWLVPVVTTTPGKDGKDYIDFMSAHALRVWADQLDAEPNASRAFNWAVLR